MASLAALGAYGSDSDDESGVEKGVGSAARTPGTGALSLPVPQAGCQIDEPEAKRPRRTFQLLLPAPKNSAAASKSDDESSDDEDAKRFAANRKGSGLLASVSARAPCQFVCQCVFACVPAASLQPAASLRKHPALWGELPH